jgi:hypothetical protein
MDRARFIEITIVIIFEVIFAALAIQAIFIEDTPRLYNVLVAMIIAVLPIVFEKIAGISLPFGVKSLVPFALFLHVAGGIMRWYWLYMPFYDKFAHIIASLAIGLCVFVFFILLDYYGVKVSKWKVLLGIFIITMIFGGIWEVGEKTIDVMVKSSYNNGLIDTIGDQIGNIIGTIIAVLIAYVYLNSVPTGKNMAWLIRKREPS